MNASISPGRDSARMRSGSFTSSTTSASLQATNAMASRVPVRRRKLDIDCSSTEKGARPPRRVLDHGGENRLERRAQTDGDGAEVRERERIHRVDGCRAGAIQLGPSRQPDFRIKSAIAGNGPQVPADDADLP